MGKKGQPNLKGIIYQSGAAISLFLQYLKKPNFSYIHLEAPEFQDFNLVFNDGKKIICEAKNWKKKFSYSNLRKILDDILNRKNLGKNDEILFICNEINKDLEEKVKYAEYFISTEYFKKEFYPFFKKKKFTDEQINILPQVKFWKVSEDINENIVYSLFEELLDFWLPEDDLWGIINHILIDKIYKGSAIGDTFSRDELFTEIENMKINIIKKTGYLDDAKRNIPQQIKDLIKALENNKSPNWADYNIAALSAKPDLMFFVLKRLENVDIKNLSEWNDLWEKIIKLNYFSHRIFKIFSNNLQNTKNRQYILDFVLKYLPNHKSYFLDNFLIADIVRIIAKITEKEHKVNKIALKIIEKVLDNYDEDYFYLKSDYDQHRNWEKEQISILLRKLFKKGNYNQKEIIYKQIFNYFNLVKDEGEYWHYTPEIIFEILREYLIEDYSKFEEKFTQLTNDLIKQYDKLCKKYLTEYKGWEIIGEFTVYSPNKYLITDKHFICYLLEPALVKYNKHNPKKAWDFILGNCIIPEKKVNRIRPDFLNRASIPIILEEYKNKDERISKEAFIILKEFISSKKGIPNKRKLIFQKLKKDFLDNKNNYLVEEYIKKYKLPYDPFIEDIIIQLAKDGNQRARDIIEEWTNSPDFLEKTEMLGRDVVSRIENYLDYSFPVGLKLFKNYISQDDFINNDNNIEVYRIANILSKIIYQDFQSGIEIINNIIKNKKLSNNQQIMLFYCLLPKSEDMNKPKNLEIFEKLYCDFLDPFLNNLSNEIKKIEKRITQPQAREVIVDFAEALAKNKKIKEAMRIVEIFINDSNPCTPQKIDPKDPEGKYDKHRQIINGKGTNTITTVRGKCAWALRTCIGLAGREYLEKIIYLTEKLTNDKNYYIQEQSCVTLSRLAQVRFSIMPENKEELFFNQDKEKALKMAKKIEEIAFDSLEKFLSLDQKPRSVLINQLLRVFNYLKSINRKSAEKLLNSVLKCNDEVISESVPLFIYFAEFRHRFYHDWEWNLPGLFDDLADFDNKIFKDTLIEIIKRENPKINVNFAWHFNDIVKNTIGKGDSKESKSIIGYEEAFKMVNYYLNIIAESYDKESFERIYRFIIGDIDKHFEECYVLWQKCLREERDFIEKNLNSTDTRRMYWWPFDNNGEILESIKDKAGNEEFLKSFKLLLDYPIKYYFPDIEKALKILEELPKKYNKEVSELFQKLITKEPKYFDRYEKWKIKDK